MKKNYLLLCLGAFITLIIFMGFKSSGIFDRDPNALKQPGSYIVSGPTLDNPVSSLFESFEGVTFPPAGWIKLNPDGGSGWNRQVAGTSPIPGWGGGTITAPPGGGVGVAFCTWNTGGATSNDQWLVTPQITDIQAGDSLKFWLRYWPNSYRDSIEVKISTTTPTAAAFTTLVWRKNFALNSPDTNWTQYGFNIGSLVPAGSNIYIAFREVVADNFNDGASFSLDLVEVTSGPPPPPPAALGWKVTPTGQTVGFDGLYVLNENTAWVSGDQGRILRSTNGGDSWEVQTTNTTQYIYSINFVDENTGYAAGGSAVPGIVLKTTNGGSTWTQVATAQTLSFLHAIHFINANTGFIGGTSGLIRTTDGGANWDITVTPSTMYQIDFADDNTGWAVGDAGAIMKTTNMGTNWVTQISGATAPFHDVQAVSPTEAWVVGNFNTVRHTTDGGTTWNTINSPIPVSLWAWGVNFVNANTGWISGDAGWIAKTTDGGSTWRRQPVASNVLSASLYQIKAANENVAWIAGANGIALRTANGGDAPTMTASPTSLNFGQVPVGGDSTLTVRVINAGTMTLTVDSISSTNPAFSHNVVLPASVPVGDTLYVAVQFSPQVPGVQNGTLRIVGNDPFNPLRTVSMTGDGTVGITVISNEIPEVFELNQNFPNPFNPSTNIRFAIPETGLVTLKVFDITGREVAVLLNEIKTPGFYNADFNASDLSSGVYFYKLETSTFRDVKRMVLIK